MQGKIKKLHEMLKNGEISSVELTKKYLDYIKATDKDINAYITVTEQSALESAKKADERIKSGNFPLLCGIPMAVKDNISTKGVLTSCASKMLSNYKPVYDAFVIECLEKEGAVMLGKVNMDEFAMGSTCETSYYGTTKNPFDINKVPGGSSGGAAACVKADMAVYALGSDTGGSVRQPASFCGTVGLKPTYGAVSRYGLIAYASSLDQIGVLAENAEDTAIVFDAISKYDERDATSSDTVRTSTLEALSGDMKGVKVGVIESLFNGLEPALAAAMENAIEVYKEMGAEIVPIEIDQLSLALPVYYILACAEATSNLARYDGLRYGYRTENFENSDEMIEKTRVEGFGSEVKRRIMLGNYVLSSGYFDAYYKKAQNMREVIKKNFAKAFLKADMLLCPTVASAAFTGGTMLSDPVKMYLTDMCTVPVNIVGLPAVSAPCGFDKSGMPYGMQLIGDRFTEARLLNAVYKFEEKTDFSKRPKFGGECIEL